LAAVPARLLVLASGAGSTLQAILDAAADPGFGATVVAVGSDVPGCGAMTRAEGAGVETFAVALRDYSTREAWNEALGAVISGYRPDLVVCAGFMRVLGPSIVARFKILNTHPSLLPAFPGAHAVRDALAYGVKVSGVTVHWVDEGLDSGPILAQAAVPVEAGDDEESLRARIQAVEKPLYVQTISQLSQRIDP
jgi:formyltetrahydrofolate-dependent phosphoribosylglycinamide formyltransferase